MPGDDYICLVQKGVYTPINIPVGGSVTVHRKTGKRGFDTFTIEYNAVENSAKKAKTEEVEAVKGPEFVQGNSRGTLVIDLSDTDA